MLGNSEKHLRMITNFASIQPNNGECIWMVRQEDADEMARQSGIVVAIEVLLAQQFS